MFNCRNTKKQGDVGLGAAIAYFTSIEATVCVPLTDSQLYDLVVEISPGQFRRVQVRTTGRRDHKYYAVQLSTCGGIDGSRKRKYRQGDYDWLFVLCSNGDRYLIPSEDIRSKTQINLGPDREDCKITVGSQTG